MRRAELRVVGEPRDVGSEFAHEVDEDAGARRPVMAARAQRREQRVAGKLRHEIAGDAADRAEGRGAGAGRAGASLVVVAVADHADAVAPLQRVVQQPFERAPGRMHLDRALELARMGILHVGVAAADMGDHDRILAGHRVEDVVGGVALCIGALAPSTRMWDERRIGRPSRR